MRATLAVRSVLDVFIRGDTAVCEELCLLEGAASLRAALAGEAAGLFLLAGEDPTWAEGVPAAPSGAGDAATTAVAIGATGGRPVGVSARRREVCSSGVLLKRVLMRAFVRPRAVVPGLRRRCLPVVPGLAELDVALTVPLLACPLLFSGVAARLVTFAGEPCGLSKLLRKVAGEAEREAWRLGDRPGDCRRTFSKCTCRSGELVDHSFR